MHDIVSTTDAFFEWIGPRSNTGEIFRIGADVAYWDGGRTLRIKAVSVPDSTYRQALLDAMDTLVSEWGGPIELVLDFAGKGPPGPGEAMALCKALKASGLMGRMVVIKQPWMPDFLFGAVTRLLKASGVAFDVRESDA